MHSWGGGHGRNTPNTQAIKWPWNLAFSALSSPATGDRTGALHPHCYFRCLLSACKGRNAATKCHDSCGKTLHCAECHKAHYVCFPGPAEARRAANALEVTVRDIFFFCQSWELQVVATQLEDNRRHSPSSLARGCGYRPLRQLHVWFG